jgi:hypothetical protein
MPKSRHGDLHDECPGGGNEDVPVKTEGGTEDVGAQTSIEEARAIRREPVFPGTPNRIRRCRRRQ